MAFLVDETTGNITLVQGDSGTLVVDGIDTDQNYKVFFSIYNDDGVIIGDEVYTYSNFSPVAHFEIPASLTDLLDGNQEVLNESLKKLKPLIKNKNILAGHE